MATYPLHVHVPGEARVALHHLPVPPVDVVALGLWDVCVCACAYVHVCVCVWMSEGAAMSVDVSEGRMGRLLPRPCHTTDLSPPPGPSS